ncbi:MAG: Transglycosylase [Candidatus Tokpelaia hoelldobleri]|uniref:Transglycosylase n=1 Tax=Candidatus Tokpelaia hoelldobleri TaxID=1902579 RepID=A0A1U9JVG1_9HYPH|nr:MAG: Transglycosylase [Candidatus Tokpelaia hoelldoblerii]
MSIRIRHGFLSVILGLHMTALAGCTTAGKDNTSPLARPVPQASQRAGIKPVAYTDMTTTASTQSGNLYALPLANENTLQLISHYAQTYAIPEQLVRRVVSRESKGNPAARNGPYWGLMQISYPTAQTMGYKGRPEGLLDAGTNLRYAVKYLAGAYLVADGDERQSVNLYARGYYYDAKRKGLLEVTGLRPARQGQ